MTVTIVQVALGAWETAANDLRSAHRGDPWDQEKRTRGDEPEQRQVYLAYVKQVLATRLTDALNSANHAAESDSVRLRLCLEYVHHRYGRKHAGKSAEQLVRRAASLLGTEPQRKQRLDRVCGAK